MSYWLCITISDTSLGTTTSQYRSSTCLASEWTYGSKSTSLASPTSLMEIALFFEPSWEVSQIAKIGSSIIIGILVFTIDSRDQWRDTHHTLLPPRQQSENIFRKVTSLQILSHLTSLSCTSPCRTGVSRVRLYWGKSPSGQRAFTAARLLLQSEASLSSSPGSKLSSSSYSYITFCQPCQNKIPLVTSSSSWS